MDCVSVNYDDFVNDVEVGDMLLVDGKLQLKLYITSIFFLMLLVSFTFIKAFHMEFKSSYIYIYYLVNFKNSSICQISCYQVYGTFIVCCEIQILVCYIYIVCCDYCEPWILHLCCRGDDVINGEVQDRNIGEM